MKKTLLFLFFSFISYAQDCKFDFNEIDAFYKIHKVKTEYQIISNEPPRTVYFSFEKSSGYFLDLKFKLFGLKSIVSGKRDSLMILLNNEEIIELFPFEIKSGKFRSDETIFLNQYGISLEQIKRVREIGVKKVRINTSSGYYEVDVSKQKWIDRLNNNIDCFLKACE